MSPTYIKTRRQGLTITKCFQNTLMRQVHKTVENIIKMYYITDNVGLGIVTVFGGYVTSLTTSSTRRNFLKQTSNTLCTVQINSVKLKLAGLNL